MRFSTPVLSLALLGALVSCSGQSRPFVPAAPAGGAGPASIAGPGSSAEPRLPTPIRNVVIIFMENRTPDNLFQGIPGADISRTAVDFKGETVTLQPVSLATNWDLNHTHGGFIRDYNNGLMNGFDKNMTPETHMRPFSYVPGAEAKPYHQMARQYVFGDRMFQTNQGPSWPAHLYIVAGTATSDDLEPYVAIENPHRRKQTAGLAQPDTYGARKLGGCDSPAHAVVPTIDLASGEKGPSPYPCFDRVVLSDFLNAKGLSWKYYQQDLGAGFWHAFDAYKHVRNGPDYANVITPPQTILTDIANGHLSRLSWVMPADPWSDHAGPNSTNKGPSFAAAIVNALGQSKYWKKTAIILLWDDWGGFYDHVKPPILNYGELGFRVPLVVISPYAKPHYVSHEQHEFGSVLAYVEETFGIPKGSLNTTDKRADDLSDCFDFTQTPIVFKTIKSPPFNPATTKNVHLEDP